MRYQLLIIEGEVSDQCILAIDENEVKTWVPNDAKNRHWVAYQEWLAEGNEPEEAEEQDQSLRSIMT